MLVENPFRKTEKGMIDHMNRDHKQALFHYSGVLKRTKVEGIATTGIDSEGFNMLADKRRLRVDFESPIHTVEDARATLVNLARAR